MSPCDRTSRAQRASMRSAKNVMLAPSAIMDAEASFLRRFPSAVMDMSSDRDNDRGQAYTEARTPTAGASKTFAI